MSVIPITSNVAVYRYGDTLAVPTFTADRSVNWTTDSGVVAPLVGVSTVLTAVNQTRVVTVTGVSGGNSGSLSIQVYATFPVQPNYGYEIEWDDKTLMSIAEDQTVIARIKSPDKRSWQLQFPNRPLTEYNTLKNFWSYHRKVIPFYYLDLAIAELKLCRFDSGLRTTPVGPDQFSMTCVVKEI